MRNIMVALLCVLMCSPLYAAETWIVRALGNDDLIKSEVGWRPGLLDDRTEVGLTAGWMDGIGTGRVESWLVGVYGTYDLVKDAPLVIATYQVPVTWYVGTVLGVLWPEDSSADATCSLMTGLNFGDGKIRLGIRGEYALTDTVWSAFADIPDEARLLATIDVRF